MLDALAHVSQRWALVELKAKEWREDGQKKERRQKYSKRNDSSRAAWRQMSTVWFWNGQQQEDGDKRQTDGFVDHFDKLSVVTSANYRQSLAKAATF